MTSVKLDLPSSVRPADRQQQLRALAHHHGIPLIERKEALKQGSLPQFATTSHYDQATKLLANARRNSENFKDPSKKLVNRFKSQSKKERLDKAANWDFSYEERAAILEANVRLPTNFMGMRLCIRTRQASKIDPIPCHPRPLVLTSMIDTVKRRYRPCTGIIGIQERQPA
jgi:hypothetical protein